MSARDLKLNIIHLLDQTEDEEFLNSILVLLLRSLQPVQPGVAGYDADGSPVTEEELVKSILDASREMREGKKISINEMKAVLGL